MFYVDTLLYELFCWVASWVGWVSLGTYLLVVVYQQVLLHIPQDLKKKYNAQWALVTGASSGIGRALAVKLATQGINVVLVALDDDVLAKTYTDLQKQFAGVTFRKVGVNLGAPGQYMKPIIEGTKDISIQLVFNNAGFIVPGFFADTDLSKIEANLECNAVCAVHITHHFSRLIMERREHGLITFTSSAGGYFPGPTATMYSSSKAFLTNFGMTIAPELRAGNIDVVVMHPSPVASRFYEKTAALLTSLQQAQKAATTPETIADHMFAAAGRLVVWDQGVMCAIFRVVTKIFDWALLGEVISRLGWMSGDFQTLAAKSKLLKAKN